MGMLLAFKRAAAGGILIYFAVDAAKWLQQSWSTRSGFFQQCFDRLQFRAVYRSSLETGLERRAQVAR